MCLYEFRGRWTEGGRGSPEAYSQEEARLLSPRTHALHCSLITHLSGGQDGRGAEPPAAGIGLPIRLVRHGGRIARPTGQADPRPMTPAKLNNHDSHKARLAQATRTNPQPQTQQPQPTTGTGPQQSQPPNGPTMDPHSRPSTAGPRQPEPGQPRHTTHCPAPHAAANPTSSAGHIGPTTRCGCSAFRF